MDQIIDSHHHLWNPARGDYGWMEGLPQSAKNVLYKPYRAPDLNDIWRTHNVAKTVLVQAAPTVNETEYMLGIADANAQIAGVIGWVDFEDPNSRTILARLAKHPKFLGVRPMIQDLPDDDWMLRDDIQWAFEAIIEHDLIFEALGFPRHIANFRTLFARYPDMRVVLDHCMKPQIRDYPEVDTAFNVWADGMSALAQETKAVCKFSALVTEAKPDWIDASLKPFTDHVIAAFGADRLMWGSDWPVALLASPYDRWLQTAKALTAHMSPAEQKAIFFDTAKTFYRMDLP
ncbi:MAG: amidohydrolase family protein [Pseudomonadota bacterium]